ncbi:MAG TPA: tripartite tricarboxylate transporter TctB family protein [Geminicoccaceae bacterium]|nr:tripartite tricarboxylate transporter TctB family protein [Geminicoccaceae bacterium]
MATEPQPAIGEESSGYAPPVLDLIAAACLVALSVWVMIESARMQVPDALATAPGLLPFLTAGSLCIMALALGWQALLRRRGAAALKGAAPDASELWRTLILAAIIGCYLLALEVLSFEYALAVAGQRLALGSFELVSTIVLSTLLAMYWGRPLVACLAVSAGWILALSAAFRYVFELPLPG